MKYIFIINDIAGKGKAKKLQPNIEAQCKNRNIDYEIRHISKEKRQQTTTPTRAKLGKDQKPP